MKNSINTQDVLLLVDGDISKIQHALQYKNYDEMLKLHMELDGRYQAAIKDWGNSMMSYIPKAGFSYDFISENELELNLMMMKSKLESYKLGLNAQKPISKNSEKLNVVVNNNNSINVDISFDDARSNIENMPGLTQKQTEEILERINELERIKSENDNKKKKWEKVKPILQFAIDKGVDVAMVVMELVAKMNMN